MILSVLCIVTYNLWILMTSFRSRFHLQENHKKPTMIKNSSSFTLLPLGHVDSPLFCLLVSVSSFSVGGKLRGSLFSEDTNKDFWTFNVRFYIHRHETAFESRIKAVVHLRYCLLSCR